MTISVEGARFTYAGNGSSTAFSFPRQFQAATDLKVYVVASTGAATLKTLATHYTVSGVGDLSGGVVNFITAPVSGETVVIFRDTPATQGLDLSNVTAFPTSAIEDAFDRGMLLLSELKDKFARTIMAPLTRLGVFDYTLPTPVANKILGVKADGSGFQFVDQIDSEVSIAWGNIGGDIADQTDLSSAINGKQAADPLLDDIAALTDPNADRIPFWDDSAGHIVWLTIGANLTIAGTTISASGGGGGAGDWGTIGGDIADQTDLQAIFTGYDGDISDLVADVATLFSGKSNIGHGHAISDITNLQTTLDGKQASGSYAAASHTHTASDISNFNEALDDRVAALLVGGTDIDLVYNDAGNSLTVNYTGAVAGIEALAAGLALPTGAQSVTITLSKTYKRLEMAMVQASHAGGAGTTQNFRIQVSCDGGATWHDVATTTANGAGLASISGEVFGAMITTSGAKHSRGWVNSTPGTITYAAINQTGDVDRIRFITDGNSNNFDAGTYWVNAYP